MREVRSGSYGTASTASLPSAGPASHRGNTELKIRTEVDCQEDDLVIHLQLTLFYSGVVLSTSITIFSPRSYALPIQPPALLQSWHINLTGQLKKHNLYNGWKKTLHLRLEV